MIKSYAAKHHWRVLPAWLCAMPNLISEMKQVRKVTVHVTVKLCHAVDARGDVTRRYGS